MSEERKTKTDAAAPASAALGRIDRKDAFLQALHTFLTAHQGTEWAVAAVDIQHFKLYNELYGTEKGDALLETVANCLLGYSRQTGYPVGYFGNDDFFLCLPDEKAEQTAVLATLQACMAAGRQDVTFFVVMGVCPVQANPGADAATLCNYAQIAGVTTDSGYLHRFEPTMLNELKEQQQLLGELERALDNHEFCFFLQPKCNSITRAIVGMEALVRWKKEPYGAIPPGLFIDWLENDPSMYDLGNFVLEQALWDSKLFLQQNTDFFINVNVSAKQLERPDFCRVVLELLDKTEFPVRHLCLEITERCRSLPVSVINERMAVLRGYGIKFAMDDFGTGSSSSAMALEMLIDEIKIDMSFIRKILVNKKNKAIVQSMVDFANAANIKSCLEGVENKALEDYLRTVGATWFQGYYYSKPVGADELEILLSAKK